MHFTLYPRHLRDLSAHIALLLSPVLVLPTVSRAQTQPANGSGVALVRHAPTLNGSVDGSVQQMLGEAVTLNGGAAITGDFLVPGTPTVRLNGKPAYVGHVWIQLGCGKLFDVDYWRGRLAHVAVYPRVLSEQQIQNHYCQGNGGKEVAGKQP